MSNEKKSRYTEAQAKAAKKYLKESVEDIRIRVPKGRKEVVKSHAEKQGESMNAFVVRAIDETMQRDTNGETKDATTSIINISDTNSHRENELPDKKMSDKKKKATNEE